MYKINNFLCFFIRTCLYILAVNIFTNISNIRKVSIAISPFLVYLIGSNECATLHKQIIKKEFKIRLRKSNDKNWDENHKSYNKIPIRFYSILRHYYVPWIQIQIVWILLCSWDLLFSIKYENVFWIYYDFENNKRVFLYLLTKSHNFFILSVLYVPDSLLIRSMPLVIVLILLFIF
jgi:hypothetical protein